jgi:non-specific serine/threonine protein kinase/serine/threonine-protein kinase
LKKEFPRQPSGFHAGRIFLPGDSAPISSRQLMLNTGLFQPILAVMNPARDNSPQAEQLFRPLSRSDTTPRARPHMPEANGCPTRDDLRRFLLGQIEDHQAARIQEHLSACQSCLEIAGELPAEDTLIAAMRAQAQVSSATDAAVVKGLIDRLNDLHEPQNQIDRSAGDTTSIYRDIESTSGFTASVASSERTVTPGQRRGRFSIVKPHAQGGLGQVSIARDEKLRRQVALKEIRADRAGDPSLRQRFITEAEITGQLEHPGIVPIYALDEDADGQPYYAMRFIQGRTLADAIRDYHAQPTPLVFRELLQRFVTVCQTIAYAHSKGVIHRDLKPANIMLGDYGETLVVDWGLAKIVGSRAKEGLPDCQVDDQATRVSTGGSSTPTMMGTALGTPAYMSPEQAAGRLNELGPATDVYSLGATLYALLTGHVPFDGDDHREVLRNVELGRFQLPRARNRNTPRGLEAICQKAMSRRPSDRFVDARELADEIERYLADEPLACYLGSLATRVRRWGRKHRAVVASAAVGAAVLLVALAAGLGLSTRHNAQLLAEQHKTEAANAELANANIKLRESNEQERLARLDAQARQAEAETARAEEAQARKGAEAVTDYLVQAFRSPDPKRDGRTIGLYEESIPLLEEVHDVRQTTLEQNHPDTLRSMNNLATAYHAVGKVNEALPRIAETLVLMLEKLGPEHPYTLTSMNNFASAYQAAGDVDLALLIFQGALKLSEARLGPEHPHTLTSMNHLASAYQAAEKVELALPLFTETLKRRRAKLGPEHPDTLISMINLASAYLAAGQVDLALPLSKETLKLCRAKLGPEHPHTLSSMHNLASAYQAAGNLDLAVPLHEDTLKLRQAKSGPEHPDTLASMNNLAWAYHAVGRLDLALPLREKTLKVCRAQLGPEHPHTLASMNDLASAYQAAGNLGPAVLLHEDTLKLRLAKFGPAHADTLMSMNNLGVAYMSAGKLEQALPLLEEATKVRRAKPGPEHPDTLSSMGALGRAYLLAKQFGAAETTLRDCLAIRQQKLSDDWLLFNTKSMLGEALAGQQKFAQAEPLVVEGYRGLKEREMKIPAAFRIRLTEALQRLVDLYIAWDKPEEATRWKKLLDDESPKQP